MFSTKENIPSYDVVDIALMSMSKTQAAMFYPCFTSLLRNKGRFHSLHQFSTDASETAIELLTDLGFVDVVDEKRFIPTSNVKTMRLSKEEKVITVYLFRDKNEHNDFLSTAPILKQFTGSVLYEILNHGNASDIRNFISVCQSHAKVTKGEV